MCLSFLNAKVSNLRPVYYDPSLTLQSSYVMKLNRQLPLIMPNDLFT